MYIKIFGHCCLVASQITQFIFPGITNIEILVKTCIKKFENKNSVSNEGLYKQRSSDEGMMMFNVVYINYF